MLTMVEYAHAKLLAICFIFCPVVITVGYELTTYTISEDQGAVNLSVIIFAPPTGGAPRPFSLSVSTGDGSAGTASSIY